MIVKKLNIVRLAVFIIVIATLIIIGARFVKQMNYEKTYEYKLLSIGYSSNEVKTILEKLSDNQVKYFLKFSKDSKYIEFIKQRYFDFEKLDYYIEYLDKNKDTSLSDVIAIINVGSDKDFLDNIKDTNIEDGILMLVNRYYGLPSDFSPSVITRLSEQYAYSGVRISKEINDPLVNLIQSAKEAGFTFVASQGYRSYSEQKKLYDSYKNNNGEREADIYVARPGHSEYQTGLALLLVPYNKVIDEYKMSEEYIWLKENSYKYGFILRLPEGRENITKFKYDPWKIRYVGEEAALSIYENNLTFEEYCHYNIKDKEQINE